MSLSGPPSCSSASAAPFLMSTPTTDRSPESGDWVAILMTVFDAAGAPPAGPHAANAMLAMTNTVKTTNQRLDIFLHLLVESDIADDKHPLLSATVTGTKP